ncbi:MAG TPA: sulfatase-like hydrolase/transferase, partial [Oceanipulchritudo sp.]|nr:sulfatase-like hydrolase/transferase [Oceanipulchritudo sp.]
PMELFPFDENEPERAFNRNDVAAADSCRDFIRGEDPFFLYFCSFNPHRDGRTIEENPYRPNSFGNPRKAFPGDTERTFEADEVIVPPFLNDTPEARAELAQYYQSIARLDRGIGRLLEILREEGKYEETLIIYVSDNGAPFPGSKTTLYDPGMQLPCIVRAPGQGTRGVVSDAMVSWVDLTPTILDFADALPNGSEFHGQSIRDILDEPSPVNWRDKIHASHSLHEITGYYPMRVIRNHRYKFIWNIAAPLEYPTSRDLWESATWQAVLRDRPERFGGRLLDAYLHRPAFELYDIEKDPGEVVNLALDPSYKDLLESFKAELHQFQEDTRDPWAHKWSYE